MEEDDNEMDYLKQFSFKLGYDVTGDDDDDIT